MPGLGPARSTALDAGEEQGLGGTIGDAALGVDRSRLARAEVGVAHRVDRVGARRCDRVLHAARHGENAGKRRQNADRAKFCSSPRALHSCTPPLLSLPKP